MKLSGMRDNSEVRSVRCLDLALTNGQGRPQSSTCYETEDQEVHDSVKAFPVFASNISSLETSNLNT